MAILKRGPLKGTEVKVERQEPVRKVVLDEMRRLKPDPMPLEPPIGYKRSPTLAEQIRNMVRGEALAYAAKNAGKETFEEADDFEVDDDYDPRAPYEEEFDPPPTWEDQSERLGEFLERGRRKAERHFAEEEERKKKKVERVEKKKEEAKPEKKEEGGA